MGATIQPRAKFRGREKPLPSVMQKGEEKTEKRMKVSIFNRTDGGKGPLSGESSSCREEASPVKKAT